MERSGPAPPEAVDAVRRDVPTCTLDDTVGRARERAEAAGTRFCLVVSAEGVVLGRLGDDALAGPDDESVANASEEGPTTTRADEDLADLVDRMQSHDVSTIVVTDPDGKLIGVLHRDDAERLLETS